MTETKLISPECNSIMHPERFNVGNRVLEMDYKNKHLSFLNPNTGNCVQIHIRIFMYFMKNLDKFCNKYRYFHITCCDCKQPNEKTCPTCRKSGSILIFSNQFCTFTPEKRELMFWGTIIGSYKEKFSLPKSRNSFKISGKDMWALERVYSVLKSKYKRNV